MLAAAGFIMQRATGNPIAGPEVLGVSAGGAGLTVALFGFPSPILMMSAMSLGALAACLANDRDCCPRAIFAGAHAARRCRHRCLFRGPSRRLSSRKATCAATSFSRGFRDRQTGQGRSRHGLPCPHWPVWQRAAPPVPMVDHLAARWFDRTRLRPVDKGEPSGASNDRSTDDLGRQHRAVVEL
jgi:hypothetical protein